jgi:hypothetical protein
MNCRSLFNLSERENVRLPRTVSRAKRLSPTGTSHSASGLIFLEFIGHPTTDTTTAQGRVKKHPPQVPPKPFGFPDRQANNRYGAVAVLGLTVQDAMPPLNGPLE